MIVEIPHQKVVFARGDGAIFENFERFRDSFTDGRHDGHDHGDTWIDEFAPPSCFSNFKIR